MRFHPAVEFFVSGKKSRRPSGRQKSVALVAELVDARDLKSLPTQVGCEFNSCPGHKSRSFDRLFLLLALDLISLLNESQYPWPLL